MKRVEGVNSCLNSFHQNNTRFCLRALLSRNWQHVWARPLSSYLALSLTHHLLPSPSRKPCPCMSESRAAGGTRAARTDEWGRESDVGGSGADRDVGGGGRRGRRLELGREERRFTKHSTGSNRTGSELVEQGQGQGRPTLVFV